MKEAWHREGALKTDVRNVKSFSRADATPQLCPSLTHQRSPAHIASDWLDALSRCGHVDCL